MGNELYVVTGGGTGMGRDIALRLTEHGHQVVVVGRREQPLIDVAASADDGLVQTVTADVSTVEGAHALLAAVADRAVTGVVTAAGGQGEFYRGMDDPASVGSRWSEAMDKNFYSALLPVETLLSRVADRRGRIVLISSTAALDGAGGPYAAAKAALVGYGRDLATRAGGRGVTANIVAPGFVADTEFFKAGGFGSTDDSMIEQASEGTLVGRVGTPRDITHTVLGLLHEDSGWTTGQVITPNGGAVLY